MPVTQVSGSQPYCTFGLWELADAQYSDDMSGGFLEGNDDSLTGAGGAGGGGGGGLGGSGDDRSVLPNPAPADQLAAANCGGPLSPSRGSALLSHMEKGTRSNGMPWLPTGPLTERSSMADMEALNDSAVWSPTTYAEKFALEHGESLPGYRPACPAAVPPGTDGSDDPGYAYVIVSLFSLFCLFCLPSTQLTLLLLTDTRTCPTRRR